MADYTSNTNNPIVTLRNYFGLEEQYLDASPSPELEPFIHRLENLSSEYLNNKVSSGNIEDFTTSLFVSQDGCSGYLFIFPPLQGGKDVNMAELLALLAKQHIGHGVNYPLLTKIAREKQYAKLFLFATGIPPIHGEDGRIEHLISINTAPRYDEDAHGNVNFKNLNTINNITKNTCICNIIAPTLGADGLDIKNQKLKAIPGKAAVVPKGNHTFLSEDGLELRAELDGNLVLKQDKYHVETTLSIDCNIDNSIGNLNFLGDIHIRGIVKSGFTVEAKGNITIDGEVEDSVLCAGGNLSISHGVTGFDKSSLQVGGTLTCKYLENTTVNCEGMISCDSIINCNINCNDSIYATEGKATIIGGNFNVFHKVVAGTIGSKTNKPVRFNLGISYKKAEEMNFLTHKHKEDKAILSKIDSNIHFLSTRPTPSQAQVHLLQQLKEQAALYQASLETDAKRLQELQAETSNFGHCSLYADLLYAPAHISIHSSHYHIRETWNRHMFLLSEDNEIIPLMK